MIREKGGYRKLPIAAGVTCETCGIAFLINKKAWRGPIEPVARDRASFMLRCRCTACGARRAFHRSEVKLYTVSSHRYAAGSAQRGEYTLHRDQRISQLQNHSAKLNLSVGGDHWFCSELSSCRQRIHPTPSWRREISSNCPFDDLHSVF